MEACDHVFLGPPGAGKGTQAKRAAGRWKVPHISTGDLFRANLKAQTPVGLMAQGFIDRGVLVPDEIVCQMVWDRLDEEDAEAGFILDGFPRTTVQAEELDGQLRRLQRKLRAVVSFALDDAQVIERICGRLTCKACGAVFHRKFNPPTEDGRCDSCGAQALYVRKDDTLEAVKARLKEHHEKTTPLLAYYGAQGNVVTVDASQSIEAVEADLEATFEGR